ncbi:MAG: TRAP transporter small permease [Kiritimatiellae bacterium]|nr:TRAP transporter small permease [Kiritimatiellia bacterium]
MPRKLAHAWERAGAAIAAAETVLLAVLVAGMVLLAAAQILLRNFMQAGFLWADPLLGMGLLWLTMLGALAATGARRHIVIDLVGHFAPPRLRRAIGRLTALFAAVVCGFLAVAAARFCLFQKEMETNVILQVPVWVYYLIIPVAFGLMALRFALQALGPGDRPPRETPS